MKPVTAYEDQNGKVHHTKQRAVAADLCIQLGFGATQIDWGEAICITNNAKAVIEILRQLDDTPPAKTKRLFVGMHEHKHGATGYLFESSEEPTNDDFIAYLGDEFNHSRENAYLEEMAPERIDVAGVEQKIPSDSDLDENLHPASDL